jgi:hypothetical protein
MKEEDVPDMGKNDKCKAVTSQDEKLLKDFRALIEKNLSDPDANLTKPTG